MVARGPLGSVLGQSGLVLRQTSVLQREGVLSLLEWLEAVSSGSLEGIRWLDSLLEVHPVLGGLTELLLAVVSIVSNRSAHWQILIIGWQRNGYRLDLD